MIRKVRLDPAALTARACQGVLLAAGLLAVFWGAIPNAGAQNSTNPDLGLDRVEQQGQGATLPHQVAILQGLDKITARVSPIYGTLGLPTYFGSLEIVVRTCRETPPTEPPESAAFLEIREVLSNPDQGTEPAILFSGWMFASSPAISALEHPVYDVWVVDCEEPIAPPALRGNSVLDTIAPPSP